MTCSTMCNRYLRLIPQLWNMQNLCSKIGVTKFGQSPIMETVNSLNPKLRKHLIFAKKILLGRPIHIKSNYVSQDFTLQLDILIILPPEVI